MNKVLIYGYPYVCVRFDMYINILYGRDQNNDSRTQQLTHIISKNTIVIRLP